MGPTNYVANAGYRTFLPTGVESGHLYPPRAFVQHLASHARENQTSVGDLVGPALWSLGLAPQRTFHRAEVYLSNPKVCLLLWSFVSHFILLFTLNHELPMQDFVCVLEFLFFFNFEIITNLLKSWKYNSKKLFSEPFESH